MAIQQLTLQSREQIHRILRGKAMLNTERIRLLFLSLQILVIQLETHVQIQLGLLQKIQVEILEQIHHLLLPLRQLIVLHQVDQEKVVQEVAVPLHLVLLPHHPHQDQVVQAVEQVVVHAD